MELRDLIREFLNHPPNRTSLFKPSSGHLYCLTSRKFQQLQDPAVKPWGFDQTVIKLVKTCLSAGDLGLENPEVAHGHPSGGDGIVKSEDSRFFHAAV